MLGPVLALEWMRSGRRLRAHALRWLVGGWLVALLLFSYSQYVDNGGLKGDTRALALFAQPFFEWLIVQQYLFVVVITPAVVAGSITEEKSRGTLEHLLTSQIGPLSIVTGKLLARLIDVVVLVLVALPMIVFMAPYAGGGLSFLAGQAAVTLMTAFGLGGLSLLASVWTRQTRTAVVAVYAAVALAFSVSYLRLFPLPGWTNWLNPIWLLMPAQEAAPVGETVGRLLRGAVAWGGLGVVGIGLAAWRLRPAYCRQMAAKTARWAKLRRWLRPAPTWNPLTWKERFVGQRIPKVVGLAAVGGFSFWLLSHALNIAAAPAARATTSPIEIVITYGWFALGILTLLVGVQAAGAVTGERERQTWDGLLMSPMTFSEILRGKLRGILAANWPYVMAYLLAVALAVAVHTQGWTQSLVNYVGTTGVAAGLVAVFVPRLARVVAGLLVLAWGIMGDIPVYCALLLTMATAWLTMEFFGAVGLWCSVRSKSTWRSVLTTAFLGYAGATVLPIVSAPVGAVTALIAILFSEAIDSFVGGVSPELLVRNELAWSLLPLGFAVGTALVYWWVARSLIFAAEQYLLTIERIPTGRARLFDVERERLRKRVQHEALAV